MKAKFLLAALAGLGLATALVAYYGLDAVGSVFLAAGWRGLAAITAFQLLPLGEEVGPGSGVRLPET